MHAFTAVIIILSLIARPVFAIPLPSFGQVKFDLLARTNLASSAPEAISHHERSEDVALFGRMHARDLRRPIPAFAEAQPRSIIFSREDLPHRTIVTEDLLIERTSEPSIFIRAHPRDFRAILEARRLEEAREAVEIARAIIEPVLYAREHAREFRRVDLPERSVENTPIEDLVPEPRVVKTHPRDFHSPTETTKSADAAAGPTISRKYDIQHRSSEGPQCAAKRRLNMLD